MTLAEAVELIAAGNFYGDYDKATEALSVIRRAQAEIETFVHRVEIGEVRSRRTYAGFKVLLTGATMR